MDYKTTLNYDIIRCKLKIIERNAYGYHIGGKTMGIKTSRFEKIMRDAVQAISDLLIENQELLNDKKKAEAEVEKLRNEHLKIQYGGEELTVQELCNRLEKIENEKKTAINDLRVCSIEGFMQCQYCLYKTAKSFCWDCIDGSNWRYRGE